MKKLIPPSHVAERPAVWISLTLPGTVHQALCACAHHGHSRPVLVGGLDQALAPRRRVFNAIATV